VQDDFGLALIAVEILLDYPEAKRKENTIRLQQKAGIRTARIPSRPKRRDRSLNQLKLYFWEN
jgi:hypothetical protein